MSIELHPRPEPLPPPRAASRMSTVSRMTVSRRPSTRLPEDDGGWQSVGAMEFNKFKKKVAKKYLDVGTSAICVHNKGGHLYDVRMVSCTGLFKRIWSKVAVKHWIVIAYAMSCCLLPKQTPYDL